MHRANMGKTGFMILALAHATFAAPQLLTFDKNGHIGVNFGGYHAGVGGGAGGLFAEAGTPQGQAAAAGIRGSASDDVSGQLFAGATAGHGVQASAGLGGEVVKDYAAGVAHAAASAGPKSTAARLGGITSYSPGVQKVKHVDIVDIGTEESVETRPVVKKGYKIKIDDSELENVPLATVTSRPSGIPSAHYAYIENNVYEERIPIRKPHHHHRKHGFAGTYVKSVAPVIQQPVYTRRSDTIKEGAELPPPSVYTKTITRERNPSFFTDIFNIPIQTLRSVGNFLTGGANTQVSVQKTASYNTGYTKNYA